MAARYPFPGDDTHSTGPSRTGAAPVMVSVPSPSVPSPSAPPPARRALPERAPRRPSAGVASAVVVAVLGLVNVTEHLLGAGRWLGLLSAVGLVGFVRWSGLSWSQLGLGADRLRSGSRWGIGAVAVVAGLLVPFTRGAFLDARYHLPVPDALLSAFVVTPVGTVFVEEIAFRSVLWAMLARHATTTRALLASSLLFGLWHLLPSLHLASANQGVGQAARASRAVRPSCWSWSSPSR